MASDDPRDIPVSFRIAMEGKITLNFSWPESLQRKELAASATITVNSCDWMLSQNLLVTKWKSATALASKDALVMKGALPDQDPPVSAVSILQERPLALRIALLRSGKSGKEGFHLIGANYRSEALNDDSVRPDPDDLTALVRLPTSGSQTALIHQVPLKTLAEEQHEQTLLLERTIRPCIPPIEQPTLRDSFTRARDAASKPGDVKILASRFEKTPRRQSGKTTSGRSAESSSAYETDAPSAALNTSIKGKYHHQLDHYWFKKSVPRGYREIFSSSNSNRTAYHYGAHVKSWISHCTTENRDPLSPSIDHLIEYLSIRAHAHPISSLRMTISAIRKFFIANLVSS